MDQFGRYQIIEQLGAGAMGAVYKAHDPLMGRDVAIKTILSTAIEGPQASEFRTRFFREAQAAGRLSHQGIVSVFDVSEKDGVPFLVMEYVAGQTLQTQIQSGVRLDIDRICDLGIQLAEALAYAHRSGVVHRDVKPANILIMPDGRAKIADFGVARLIDNEVTSTGQFLGTPGFMSPEQFTGAHIDGRSDLFALGVIIYWLATGDKPFTGDSIVAVQYRIVHTDPLPPRKLNPAVSRDLEAVILKSIAKDPAERYQTGDELAQDLQNVRESKPVSAKPVIPARELKTAILEDPTALMTVSLSAPKASSGKAFPRAPTPAPPPKKTGRPLAIYVVAVIVLALAAYGVARLRKEKAPPTLGATTPNVASAPAGAPSPAGPEPASTSLPPSATQSGDSPMAPSATDRSAEPTKKAATSDDVPKPVASKKESQPETPPPDPDTVNIEVSAHGRSSIVFRAEGQPVQTLSMKDGDSVTLHAEKQATALISDTSVLDAKVNGMPVSFGRRAGQFLFTQEGVSETSAAAGAGERAVGSPARQRELAQAGNSATLSIKSPQIAGFVTLIVRVDGEVLLRREATFSGVSGLSEERLLPPGSHKIQVVVMSGGQPLAPPQELTADFNSKQLRTLVVRFEGQRRAGLRFTATLE